jgi:hypothetical protein
MSQRCTVRLPDTLFEYLQIEADARRCGVSDLIREGLERLLGLTSDHGAETSKAPEQVAMSAPTPHDCTETALARLPMVVREGIVEGARVLDLPVSKVVTSMLIVQQPPSQQTPQVSPMPRPEKEFVTWQEFKRRWQQGSEAALSDASPSLAAPAFETSPPPTKEGDEGSEPLISTSVHGPQLGHSAPNRSGCPSH